MSQGPAHPQLHLILLVVNVNAPATLLPVLEGKCTTYGDAAVNVHNLHTAHGLCSMTMMSAVVDVPKYLSAHHQKLSTQKHANVIAQEKCAQLHILSTLQHASVSAPKLLTSAIAHTSSTSKAASASVHHHKNHAPRHTFSIRTPANVAAQKQRHADFHSSGTRQLAIVSALNKSLVKIIRYSTMLLASANVVRR